ncbi:MAG: cytochrome c family protein [Alphaproteobacteria bacterium]
MLLAGLGAALGTVASAENLRGDPARGAKVYERCEGCHSLDANRVGPLHRSVVGRKAGTVPGYGYSPALAGSGIVWDETTLDAWLANPAKLVPGTKMGFRLKDAQDRADVIAFLKAQGGE